MTSIDVEVDGSLTGPASPDGPPRPLTTRQEVAPGETLGRLLERLVVLCPPLRQLFDPRGRRLADHVRLAVNGRSYNLIGGLTYTLHDGDTVSLRPD